MATVSFILGIIALCANAGLAIPGLGQVLNGAGFVCAILSIIFGAIGSKDTEKGGMAKAGMTLGILALIVEVAGIICCVTCGACTVCSAVNYFTVQ